MELIRFQELSGEESKYLERYFVNEIQPLLSTMIVGKKQPGDIITEINGQAIVNLKDIVATLLKCSSGQTVDVRYKRADASGYQDLQASVTLKVLQ